MEYLKSLIARIQDRDQWPDFDRPHFLAELNDIADEAHDSNTVHGYLAALLIYHQLTEEMLKLLVQYSEFYVQLELAPIEIHFPIPDRTMFGQILEVAKNSMEFENKAELLKQAQAINRSRIELVHKLTKQETPGNIGKTAQIVRSQFDKFYEMFTETQDWFLLCFKDLKKDKDWDELLEE